MKIGMTGCIACALLGVWAAGAATAEDAAGNPYDGIVVRNVFGLKPPPPPPDPESVKPPPPKITLQGITTLMGKKLALMKVMVPASKPGAKAEEVPLTLSIGEKSEDVEVLEIHEVEPKWVKVNDYGTITNLNFKDNGVNLAAAPGPTPGGAQPRPGAAPSPMPTAPPAYGRPNAAPVTTGRSVPSTRGGRYSTAAAAYNPTAASQYAGMPPTTAAAAPLTTLAPGSTAGAVSLNGLGGPASPIQQSRNWPPETPMTPEQSAIMEAAYTMKYQQQIQAGTMPSIPGSNPILDNGATQQPQQPQPRTPSRF